MDTIQENVEDLVTHLTDYVETQKELFVLNAQEKAASAISQTIIWVIGSVLAFVGFTFLNTALAIWLGRLLDNIGYGFLIVGSGYALTAALFFAFRESLLQDRLNDIFLMKFMENDEK